MNTVKFIGQYMRKSHERNLRITIMQASVTNVVMRTMCILCCLCKRLRITPSERTRIAKVHSLWHWKLHWKIQPHWKMTETTLKSFTKDNHTENFSLIILKFVCYCYPRMLIPYNPAENCQRYSYPLFSQFQRYSGFSVRFSVSYLSPVRDCHFSSFCHERAPLTMVPHINGNE